METVIDTQKQSKPKRVNTPRKQSRGNTLPALVRELERMIDTSNAKFVELAVNFAELAKDEGEKLSRKTAELVNAVRIDEAREREDHAKIRNLLAVITGGAVEKLVRVSREKDIDEIRSFFREKGWRV
jgi:hypothetical protein